jgi:hypothetical protein
MSSRAKSRTLMPSAMAKERSAEPTRLRIITAGAFDCRQNDRDENNNCGDENPCPQRVKVMHLMISPLQSALIALVCFADRLAAYSVKRKAPELGQSAGQSTTTE